MKKRILFVDDEPAVLNGLRRALRKQHLVWDMDFVNGADECLKRLREFTYDVVITDVRMPQMNGVELLRQVRELYPNIARIVLSGHPGEETMSMIAQVAHQALFKPVDSKRLIESIAHACSGTDTPRNAKLNVAVTDCDNLPSLPGLYLEITRVAASATCSAADLAAVISRDIAMTAKLLQMVNSAFFGLERRVSHIERAIALLGVRRIQAMALVDHVFTQFSPDSAIEGFSAIELWRRAFQVATLAREISLDQQQLDDRPEQAFTAGLLQDAGLLVLATRERELFRDMLYKARDQQRKLVELEQEALATTHAAIGGQLLELWGLPIRIVEAVRLHHTPGLLEYTGMAALTTAHVADALVTELDESPTESLLHLIGVDLDYGYLERIGLSGCLENWRGLAEKCLGKVMVPSTW